MQLRPYQHEAVEATWGALCNLPGSPLIVLPTGAGKSLVIAKLAQDAVERFGGRVLVVAHRKELLEQNADKIRRLIPTRKVGLFSSGLRRWDAESEIVCAGIQSCYKKATAFGARHLVLIDEVHLVPSNGEGMYRTFLDELRAANPRLRMVGLTATPFRTGEGSLCGEDRLFQRIAYTAEIKPLIDGGYLSPVTSKPVEAEQDTSKLHTRNGEFVPREVQDLFDQAAVTKAAVAEIVAKTAQRRSILIFAASVAHAQHVADEVAQQTGEDVGVVTGETSPLERASTLKRFQNCWLRWLINVDVLTTGFDAPNIDAIAVLRATQSPGLFAQICGRGFRLFPGKRDCLVLDFGENIKRHGPLDASDYGLRAERRGSGTGDGEAPSKDCPNCNEPNALTARECACGLVFPPPPPRHEAGAGDAEILAANEPPRMWECDGPIRAGLWTNRKTGSRTLRIDYDVRVVGGNMRDVISEWICLEHDGYAGTKAQQWWAKRCAIPAESIEHAVELWEAGAVALPSQITTQKDGRWNRITDYVLTEAANPEGELAQSVMPADAWDAPVDDFIPF